MDREESEKNVSEQAQQNALNQYPSELMQAIEKTTFSTLAVVNIRGFEELKITMVQKIVEDIYAVRFTYFTLNKVEKEEGWIIEKTLTESQGLYIHQFASTLYLDAYAISNFVNDRINPPQNTSKFSPWQ